MLLCKASYTQVRRMVRKSLANQMCVYVDGAANLCCDVRKLFAYHSPRTEICGFCSNTKRTGCAGCPFLPPGVLCSPQVRRKLINGVPNTHRMRTAQRVSSALVYTRFKALSTLANRMCKAISIHHLASMQFGLGMIFSPLDFQNK